jgi:hypothetical protein
VPEGSKEINTLRNNANKQTNANKQNMKSKTNPAAAYRAAIHNQIYHTIYYHVSKYIPGKGENTWVYETSWGYRGRGNALGLSFRAALKQAQRLNEEMGWKPDSPNQPRWMRFSE